MAQSFEYVKIVNGGKRNFVRIHEITKQQRFLELAIIDEQKYSSTPYCVYASKKTKWNDQVDIGFVYWIMYLVHTHCFTYASAKRFRICTKTRKCEKMFSINKVTDKGRWGL